MMELKRFEFVLEAQSPIAHHQETFGNSAAIFRRKVRQPDGQWAMVPFVTGDSMRHQLREAAAWAFLDAAGMLGDGALSEAALRLLFNGGMVTGRGDASTVRLDRYREMVDLVPSLGLLGGCADSRCIPGRVSVDDAVLICSESKPLVPTWMLEHTPELDGARAHVELHQRVRMDSLLDPGKRKLLDERALGSAEAKDRRKEEAHETDDAIARAESKSSMMPRTFEALASGAHFMWSVEALCTSDLDVDTFHVMCGAFLSNARVGGKRAVGFGKMRAIAGRGVVVNRPSERLHAVDTTQLAPKVGELFRAHVKARAEKAKTFLREVDA